MKRQIKSWERIIVSLMLCLTLILPNSMIFAFAGTNETQEEGKTPVVYFAYKDGRTQEADEENTFHLKCTDEGKFKLRNMEAVDWPDGEPYFNCTVDMKEGIKNWRNTWVYQNGTFSGHDIRKVKASIFKLQPVFYKNQKPVVEFNIQAVPSDAEDLKVLVDGKEVNEDNPLLFNGFESKKIQLKVKIKGEQEYKDIDFSTCAHGSCITENGQVDSMGNIYIENFGRDDEATFEISLNDDTKKVKFKGIRSAVKAEKLKVKAPEVIYIDGWNSLENQWAAVHQTKDMSKLDDGTYYYLDFEPKNTLNQEVEWNNLNPDVAAWEFHMFDNGIVPKKAGKASFEVTSKDNPKLKEKLTIEFRYAKPLKEAGTDKTEYTLAEGKDIDIDIKTTPSDATEQRFNWTYSKPNIVKITDSVFIPDPHNLSDHRFKHTMMALSEGDVTVTGTPIDTTGGAKPVVFKVHVDKNGEALPDYLKMAKEGVDHGKKTLSSKKDMKYSDEWNIFTLARAGYKFTEEEKEAYFDAIDEVIDNNLKSLKNTDKERVVLALGSLGQKYKPVTEDNRNQASKVLDAVSTPSVMYNEKETSNALIFGLLAHDSIEARGQGYGWKRQNAVDSLVKYQKNDGRFTLSQSDSEGQFDIDTTAMAVQALAPYYLNEDYAGHEAAKTAVDKAIPFLRSQLDDNCSYGGNGCTAAQVVVALTSLNIDPTTADGFTIGRKNLITELLKYKRNDGYATYADGKSDNFGNIQITYALDSYVRLKEGKTPLYDFSDLESEEQVQQNLEQAKKDAMKEINKYVNLADYRTEEQIKLTDIMVSSRIKLKKAKSIEEVGKIVNEAKAEMDKVKTKAEIEEEEKMVTKTILDESRTVSLEGKMQNRTEIQSKTKDTSDLDKKMQEKLKDKDILKIFHVSLKDGKTEGKLKVGLKAGNLFDGKHVTVYQVKDNLITGTYNTEVQDGFAYVEADSLGTFVVAMAKENVGDTDYRKMAEKGLAAGLANLSEKPHNAFGEEDTLFALIRGDAAEESDVNKYFESVEDKYNNDEAWNLKSLWIYAAEKVTKDDSYTLADIMDSYAYMGDNFDTIGKINAGLVPLFMGDQQPEYTEWDKSNLTECLLREFTVDGGKGGFKVKAGDEKGTVLATAFGIQALSSQYKDNEKVKEAVDNAVEYLKSQLNEKASYGDPVTDASAVIALTSVGIDPTKAEGFVKGDRTLITSMYESKMEGSDDPSKAAALTNGYNAYLIYLGSGKSLFDMDGKRPEPEKDESVDYDKLAKDMLARSLSNLESKPHLKAEDARTMFTLLRGGADIPEADVKALYDAIGDEYYNDEISTIDSLLMMALENPDIMKGSWEPDAVEFGLCEGNAEGTDTTSGKAKLLTGFNAIGLRNQVNRNSYGTYELNEKTLTDKLIRLQNEDGGFGHGGKSDVSTTAQVITALSYGYTEGNKAVVETVNKALNYLKKNLNKDYSYGNPKEDGQVITALVSLGKNPLTEEGFTNGDKNLLTALDKEEGAKSSDTETLIATADAAKSFLMLKDGKLGVFDFRDQQEKMLNPIKENAQKEIEKLGDLTDKEKEKALSDIKAAHDRQEVEKLVVKAQELNRKHEAERREGEKAKKLKDAQDKAKADLDKYKNPADYREAEQKELAEQLKAGKSAIDDAKTPEDVAKALDAAKAEIDKIKTDAQLEAEEEAAVAKKLAEAKDKAAEELDKYKNPADYREAQQKELADQVRAGKAAIDAAKTPAEVTKALDAAKAEIDKIKTDAQLKDEEAKAKNGWEKEDGKWYFYEKGEKKTGWVKDNNHWYHMNEKGVMDTGWLKDNDHWYFLNPGGSMKTGWHEIDGKYYFFYPGGSMAADEIVDGWYVGKSGAWVTGDWNKNSTGWWYGKGDGSYPRNGFVKIGSGTFKFDKNGYMEIGWVKSDGKWYYMNQAGYMQHDGWQKIGKTWYYFYGDGHMAADETIDGWFLNGSGAGSKAA